MIATPRPARKAPESVRGARHPPRRAGPAPGLGPAPGAPARRASARPVAAEAAPGASGGRGALILAAVVALLAIAGAALWGLVSWAAAAHRPPQASVASGPAAAPAPTAPKPDTPAPAAAKPQDPKPAEPATAPAGDPSAPVSLAKTAFTQGEPITVEIGRDPGLAEGKRGYLTWPNQAARPPLIALRLYRAGQVPGDAPRRS